MTCKVGNVEGLIFNGHSNQRENLKMKKRSPSCMWFYNLGEGNMLRISKAFNLPWWWWYNLLGLMSSIPLNLTNGTTESFLLNYFSSYWGMVMQLVKNPPANAGNSREAGLIAVWGGAHQAPLSMEFSRQEYWSGLPFPPPRDLPDPGIEHGSPAFLADALPSEPSGKPIHSGMYLLILNS